MQNNTSQVIGHCVFTTFLKVAPSPAIIQANIFRAVVNTVFSIICICGNSVFLKAYHSTRSLRNTSNLLLVNLAMSDLLVGCVSQPLFVLRGVLEIVSFHDCALWDIEKLAVVFLSSVSFAMLLLISFERALATFIPLRYLNISSSAYVRPIIVSVWITCLLSVLILMYSRFVYYTLNALVILVISGLMAAIYWSMCRKAREQRHKITTAQTLRHENKSRFNFYKNKKAEKTIFWVVGSVFVCYFPMFIHLVWMISGHNSLHNTYVVSTYLTTLVFVNSSLNPIIYCWRSRSIRAAAKRVILNCFARF